MGNCKSTSAAQATKADAEMEAWAKKMNTAMTAVVASATLPTGRGHRVQKAAISALEQAAAAGHTMSRRRLDSALKAFSKTVAQQQSCLDILTGYQLEEEDPEEVEKVLSLAVLASMPNFPHVGR